ncbi:K+ channel tetramerization domain protein [Teladorsagia circumcincta]|uniref:K+ channel tetramerization domain protein n=1 Tax=Teladorsagia circumcincta TaxID=45464 RepID=A0A2G9V0L4_TELCI|nr:K+ channel tetramerization domain protein [Teladorsagia circumcincta]
MKVECVAYPRAAQQHKKRLVPLRKTDAMSHAERRNFVILDDVWRSGGSECFQVADAYVAAEDSYFFQRSPIAFEAIFQYYATGVVHRPSEVDDTTFDNLMFGKVRRRMWTFLERPGSSMQAKAFELSSTLFVAISVMGLSFGTIPDFQVTHYMPPQNETIVLPNGTVSVVEKVEEMRVEHPAFVFTERICIAFFTVEYCLRLFAAPRKLRFALKPLNLVDLLAIVPFYLELLLTLCGVDDKKLRDLRWAFLVVRILRVLRVIRIIKLGRFSSGLQTFGMTLQRSQKQLQMMTIVLLTVGKIIASAAIMCGVLVLALPITIIVDNFIKVAQDEQQAEQTKLDSSRQELALQSMLHGDED